MRRAFRARDRLGGGPMSTKDGPEAVIFDFDGVLVDSAETYLRAISEAVAPVDRRDWPRLYGMTTAEAVDFASGGTIPHARIEKISGEIDLRVGDLLAHKPPARSGAEQFVRAVHAAGIKTAVASSASRHAIDGTLRALGWHELFGVVVGRDDVPRAKPFGDVYVEAVRRLGVAPERAVAIEDTHIGILAARAAGLSVAALGGTQPEADLGAADGYYDDFESLRQAEWFAHVRWEA
jgi:HAD superfamily hydrolase (TIGR01509 family)